MPESVTDRPTRSHEYLFLLTKSAKYLYDADAVKEPATPGIRASGPFTRGHTANGNTALSRRAPTQFRNRRSVWSINTTPFKGAHFAVMPEALVEPCVLAGSRKDDMVLDPFCGSGTVGVVSLRHGRSFTGVELNPQYVELANNHITNDAPLFNVPTRVA